MEFGSHTVTHPCGILDEPTLRYEFESNIVNIVAFTPEPQAELIHLAWPCGVTSTQMEVVASDYFLSARGFNFNQLENPTPYDFMNLKSFNSPEYDPHQFNPSAPANPADLKVEVDAAIAQGKWFNCVLHSMLDENGAIVYAVGKDIWVAPAGTVTKYILQRDRTVLSNYVETASQISFNFWRLPLDASSKRSFESALGPQDTVTLQMDLTGMPSINSVTVNGTPVGFNYKVAGGTPLLLFNAVAGVTSQNVVVTPGTNHPPVLGVQSNQSVVAMTTMVVTNTGTDPDLGQTLTYSLVNPPAGAQIDTNGIITWTPSSSQSPGTYTITTVVQDNGSPPLSATNSFQVTVYQGNIAPVLPTQNMRTIYGLVTLVVTNTATEADIYATSLTYQLLAAPANAIIDTNGIIIWTPTTAQIPSTNVFITVVTDYDPNAVNAQYMSATNSFTVVTLLPNLPMLPAGGSVAVTAGQTLMITNTAVEAGVGGPSQTNTILFNYPSRSALLADGWSFMAVLNGANRNTEITNPAVGGVVSYDQTAHPGVLRIPCDLGDLWGTGPDTDNTRNSLFRNLATNWVSAKLWLSFAPVSDVQQAHLCLYQDDDNYLDVGTAYNTGLGGEAATYVLEVNGNPNHFYTNATGVTSVCYRLDRDLATGNVTGLYSVDGVNWVSVGTFPLPFANPRLCIWGGSVDLPYTGSPNEDLTELDVTTSNSVPITLTYTLLSGPAGASISTNGVITWPTTAADGPGTNVITTVVTDNRVPSNSATNSFTVTVEGLLVVSADNRSRAYGQANPAFTGTLTGLQSGDNVTAVFATTATSSSPVGTYAIVPMLNDPNGNLAKYVVITNNGTLTVNPTAATVAANTKSKTYGDANPALDAVVTGTVNGDTLNYTLGTTATVSSGVGSYPITVSLGSNPNYTVTPSASTLTVNAKAATVVADAKSKTYGDANPALTAVVTGAVNGDTLNYTLGTTATATSGANSYPITVTLGSNPNYNVTSTGSTLTVNAKAAAVVADAKSKTYGDANPGLTAVVTGTINGDTLNYTLGTTATAASGAGSYPITVTPGSNPNYTVTPTGSTLMVNAKAATVVADAKSKTYGDANPALTAVVTGTINGDTLNYTLGTTATVSSGVGSYPITVSLGSNPNYTVTPTGSTLKVNAAALMVLAADASRAYGQTNPVFTVTYSGFVNGETNDVLGGALVFTCDADTNSPVGQYPIEPSGLTAVNYSLSYSNGTLTVQPYALTVTADSKSKVYGQADPAFTASYSGFVNGETEAVLGGTLVLNRVAGENVGSYAITPSGLTSTNYAITYSNGNLSIEPAALTITADNQGTAYGAGLPALTVSYSGFVNGDTAASLTTAPTVTTTGTAGSGVGTYPITASGAVDANYTISYVVGTLTVNPVPLNITAVNQGMAYGSALPPLTVSYSGFVNGDTAASLTTAPTVTTTATTGSPVGTYPITASGAADANYTISYVAGTLTVNPVPLAITANNQSKAYGAALPTLTVSYSGFVNGDTAASLTTAPTVTTTGTASSPVGTYPITASGAADANYTISYAAGTLAVNPVGLTISANNQSKAYGAALPALTVSYNGFVNGDTAASLTTAPTVTTTGTASSGVGTYPITASGAADPNYTIGYVPGTLSVNAVALTVLAADAQRAYGQTNPVFTVTYSGFVDGETNDVLGGSLVFTCSADTNSAVGQYAIEPSGLTATNYSITFSNGTLTVSPYALTVTADNKSKVYGQADPALTVSYSGFVNGETSTVLGGTLALSRVPGENVGDYAITPSGLTLTNYAITFANGTLSIEPAALTITADNQSTGYGAGLPALTVSYSGFVNGDTAASLTTAPTVTTTGTASSPVGTYPITASGAVDTNYTISYVAGTLTVNPVPLTITANNQSKAYGAALPALTVSYNGFVNGDTAASLTTAPTVTTTGTASSGVGTYPITASGAADPNYTISYAAGTLAVNPVGLTISANNQSKAYGAALPALTVSYNGFVNGDTAASLTTAPTVTTTGTASSGVGTYPITASGAADPNYTIGYVPGTLSVNAVALTVLAADAQRAYGQTNPVFTVAYSGFVDGETNDVLGGSLVFTCSADTNSAVGQYAIEPSGLTATNYSITFSNGTLTVLPYALTVTADNKSKVYGQADPAFTASYSGFVNGETEAVLGGTLVLKRLAGENVGGYAITPGGLTSTNYAITFANGTLSIEPAALTITADNQGTAYGAGLPALTVSYSGFVNGDTAASLTTAPTVTTTATASSAAGTYPITASGAADANYTISYVAGTLTVNPVPLTITANNQSTAYGAGLPTLTVSYSGFVNGDTAASLTTAPTLATTGTASSAVGTYPITASGAADPNYTISYVAGTLTVNPVGLTISANNQSKAYGAALPALTVSYNGFVNGDTAASLTTAPTVTTTGTASSPVGTYPITASGAADPNYTISYVAGTLTVNPVGLTITANNQSKAYGAALPTLTVSYSGFVNGDTVASLTTAPTVTTIGTASSAAGTYPITASGAGDANYTISYVPGTLTVNPVSLTIAANNQSKPYGAALPALTVSYSGFVNGDTAASLTTAPAVTTTATASSGAGTYPITASGAVDGNYTISYVPGILSVNAAALTVLASDAQRAYGQTNPVFTVTYNGFVNGETNDVLGGTLVFTCSADTNSPVGQYPIEPSGLTATNYSITFSNGTLTVLPYALTVTADDKSKVYGQADPALTVSYSGFVNGETSTVLGGGLVLTRVPGEDVGSYAITVAGMTSGKSAITLPGLTATNYAITFVPGTLTIEQASATVLANAKSKTYGDANPALDAVVTGTINGDTLNYTLATAATTTSGAGSYPITVMLGSNLNYNVAFTDSTLTVAPKAASVAANAKSKAYGMANPALDAAVTGVINGDTLKYTLATTATAVSGVGNYPITVTLGSNPNYNVTSTGSMLAVTAAGLRVAANNASRAYGAANPVLSGTITGIQNSDNITASYATTATVASPVGVFSIVPTLNDPDSKLMNYSVTIINGSLTVNPATLTVTAGSNARTYGETNPVFTSTVTGFVNGETSSVMSGRPSLTTTATSSSPAGNYPIIPSLGSLSAPNYTFSFVNGMLTIIEANSDLVLTSSQNPSLPGSNVTFTVTVTPLAPATTTPTGSVQFYTNGIACDGPQPLSGGIASLTLATLPIGSTSVKAAYLADNNYYGSISSLVQVVHAIAQVPSTVGIHLNSNRTLTVTFSGTPGAEYIVQASSNLSSPAAWISVSTNTAGIDGQWTFTDSAAGHPIRFYRTMVP